MATEFSFWPFLNEPPDTPCPRPEDEYGPIRDDTVHDIVAESVEEARAQLPEPPTGCHWGLVGFGAPLNRG